MSKDTTQSAPRHPSDNPCPLCGSSDFRWGMPFAGKDLPKEFFYFLPDGAMQDDGDIPVAARLCNHCGLVLLFIIDK